MTTDTSPASGIDDAGEWVWNFLKKELAPYPGRLWVVGRVTISATIVMLLVMTFKLPGGFLGAIFTFFISRENPTATLLSGFKTILAFSIGAAYVTIGVTLLLDDPLTHFLWVAFSLFLSFYLIRIFADYGTAVAFGFMVAGAIPLWDETTLNVNDRMENTLWLAFVVAIGVVVSILVEYVFRRVHPATDLIEGIESRLATVEHVLRSAAEDRHLDRVWQDKLSLYSTVGTSRLRRLILRSGYSEHFKAQMGTAVALLGRLVDIAASFNLALVKRVGSVTVSMTGSDRERCARLADAVSTMSQDLPLRRLPSPFDRPPADASSLPFLSAMESTVALIPQAFSGSDSMNVSIPAPLDEEKPQRLFVADALSNPAHAKFALRGTIAAMACYMTYTLIAWPGLSTSVATCFITALSSIGSSRQKQVLRLSGAIVGGFIFGMGSQIFVLPYLDSIAGFTPLFIVVTAIAAWIATASARLSYLGVQMALAYYIINLQEFTIQTSLAVARDRVFGVLLGLLSMWLLFDRLWVRDALDEMQAAFAHNLELFAELAEQLLEPDQIKAIKRIRQLRDQLNTGFQAVNAQADAVFFEFGPSRERKLKIREDIQRWQPTIRTLLLVQVTAVQYLTNRPLSGFPPPVAEAGVDFEQDVARVLRAMADEVSGKPIKEAAPDIRNSAARLQQKIKESYQGDLPIPSQASDIMGLAGSLAAILAPLYEDIRSTSAAERTPQGSLLSSYT